MVKKAAKGGGSARAKDQETECDREEVRFLRGS